MWEQYRSLTRTLTREYLDARPRGWEDYAIMRITKPAKSLPLDEYKYNATTEKIPAELSPVCKDRRSCEIYLNFTLPSHSSFHPRQFNTCAVVGNSAELLTAHFGENIDLHDAVIRINAAPVNKKYAKHVGLKKNFRIVGRGSVKQVVARLPRGSENEVLIFRGHLDRNFIAMIKNIQNPVYLFHGIFAHIGERELGMGAIQLALSMCDTVDIYGFSVDPENTQCTRYFDKVKPEFSRLDAKRYYHNLRAYYQLLECLGVIKIHSPMRSTKKDWSGIPSREIIKKARGAALRLKGKRGELDNCEVWGKSGPVYGIKSLRKEARDHYSRMERVSMYSMDDGNEHSDQLVCVKHSS